MPSGQGKRRMLEGVTRPLTKHEFSRGYVFISKDVTLPQILNVDSFTAEIDGKAFPNRRIDVSGRMHIPREGLALIKGNVTIKVANSKRLTVRTLG